MAWCRTPDKILAVIPPPANVKISNARFNYLTPERNSRIFPSAVAWEGLPHVKPPQHLDAAFSHARTGHPNVDYIFPVTAGKTYHVFLGVGRSEWLVGDPDFFKSLKLSVEDQSETFEFKKVPADQPVFREFVVTPTESAIRVKSEGVDGGPLLSGIWIFEHEADPKSVSAGKLNKQALFYVACGRERAEDIVTSIDLDYEALPQGAATTWIQLPYSLRPEDRQSATSCVRRRRIVSGEGALELTGGWWGGVSHRPAAI